MTFVSAAELPEPSEGGGGAVRYWAKIEYDGTDFYGFQLQAAERTVQGDLEQALYQVTRVQTRVTGAGRTDTGVHARGQVIAFDAEWRHQTADLQRALNAVLPADVAVVELGVARPGFHPRFDAQSRTYTYTILCRPWRSPLERRRAWHVPYHLDVERMAEASQCLVGTQDLTTFGRPPQGDNPVRTVMEAVWQKQDSRLMFDITANAFLHRMVRSLVGSLVLVGSGQLSPDEFRAMLAARDASRIKQIAPAQGLCLVRVNYATSEGVIQ